MTKTNSTNVLVSIEGNIGSGKSTLLANLQKKYGTNKKIKFLQEPVKEWETICDENGVTMLEKFYSDQKTHSFAFQMMAYISRLSLLKEAFETNENTIIITERSLYTDKLVFAKMLFDSGNIEFTHYQVYLKWFDTFISEFPVKYVIYVRAIPETCHGRIIKRSRQGESNIPLTYLQNCHDYHEQMIELFNNKTICKETNILCLNGNEDIYENPLKTEEWIYEISGFIDIYIQ
jgi:deoxyadenosine/deoxycytidine kinase